MDANELREKVALGLCRKIASGTCAAICMDEPGDVPAKGCKYAVRLHGMKADAAIRIVAEACAEIAEQIPPAPEAKTPGLRNAHFAYGNGRKDAGRCIRTALIQKEPNNV